MSARPKTGSLLESFHLLSYDGVDSTNEEARRLAQGGASHGAVIWAREQSAGKGRLGREWESPAGNLYASVLLQPGKPLAELPQLALLTGLAVAEALIPVLDDGAEGLRLKWPNDVIYEDRKLGGILLETEPSGDPARPWVIVGIGVNVETAPADKRVRFPATSLKAAGVDIISAKIVLSRFLSHFMERYDQWAAKGFEPIRKAWLTHAWRLNETVTIDSGAGTAEGVFRKIDPTGAIEIETAGGLETHAAGDLGARTDTA